jgi:hypothetical protein
MQPVFMRFDWNSSTFKTYKGFYLRVSSKKFVRKLLGLKYLKRIFSDRNFKDSVWHTGPN